jgi:protein TonB
MQVVEVCSKDRTLPIVMTVAVHVLIVYALAISTGILPVIAPEPRTTVVPVPPEPTKTIVDPDERPVEKIIFEPVGPKEPPVIEYDPLVRPEDRTAITRTGSGNEVKAEPPAPQTVAVRLLSSNEPLYPSLSRMKEEEGVVTVRITISAYGTILDVQVERSSGYPRLDDAAMKSVRAWRFAPAKRGSEAIVGTALVPVKFSLMKK